MSHSFAALLLSEEVVSTSSSAYLEYWSLFASLASIQRSNSIVTIARSNSRVRFQEKFTSMFSRVCITLIDQKGSGRKILHTKVAVDNEAKCGELT